MINSRKLIDLTSHARSYVHSFISQCNGAGVQLLITSTLRDVACQNELYARGRTTPGNIVTNARGGNSFHQYGVAMDFVPLVLGKPLWEVFDAKSKLMLKEWQVVAAAAQAVGVEWAGNWKSFKEYGHVQYTGGLTLSDFKQGKVLS